MRKTVSFFLIAVFLIVPVSAASSSGTDVEYIQKSSFWNWFAGKPGTDWNKFVGYTFGNSCPNSEDGYHHASSYRRPEASWGGPTGYYKCICDLCGAEFTAYESDLQQSYETQVAELPAPSYNSDGSLYITLVHAGIKVTKSGSGLSTQGISCTHTNYDGYSGFQGVGHFDCENNSVYVVPKSGYSNFIFDYVRFLYRISAPIDGYYSLCAGPSLNGSTTIGGVSSNITKSWTESNSPIFYDRGSEISNIVSFNAPSYNSSASFVKFWSFAPTYKVTPLSSFVTEINTTYNINSRPTSITGDYGIIGDNGQIVKVEGDRIVNETNNNYYNPATGETHTMSDWSYNYEDRSYTVTTQTGDTVTITYGDENVTIQEGDIIYNVYYLVNGSGSETPGPGPDVPPPCDHTWTETSRTEPTCTTAGKVTSTCSKCSQTKTETIPATGHSWVVDRTVQTTYDEEGNLLQQGYTIYSCSVCGEQYKDMEGTGPLGGDGEKSIWEKIGDFFGTIGGGFIDIIGAFFGKILDALIALAEMLMDKLKTVVETVLSIFDELPALFGGFLDFLGAVFPYLPPEITTILTFGVIAITFIGILKAVRR